MKKDFNSGKIVRQTGMSPEQYFQKLDSLLKRNKGYGMTIARDTGTNIPLNLTSTATPARMPELSGGIAAQQLADQSAARIQTRQNKQNLQNIIPYTDNRISGDDQSFNQIGDYQMVPDPSPDNIYRERLIVNPKNNTEYVDSGDVYGASDTVRTAPIDMYYPDEPVAYPSASLDRNQLADMPDIGGEIARGIQSINPTGQYGTGLAYTLQGEPDKARAQLAGTLSRIGTKIGAPELLTDELSQEQQTNPLAQLTGNFVDSLGRGMNLPEMGISELLAGGRTTNTKNVRKNTTQTSYKAPKNNTIKDEMGDVLGIQDRVAMGPTPSPTGAPIYGPNAVNPLMGDPRNQYITQSFHNYNPGIGYYNDLHSGIDLNYGPGNYGEVRAPIGGQVVDNYFNPAYGNTFIVKGLNPEEYAQLSDEEKNNPIVGNNRDYVRLSHLNKAPKYNRGDYIATGEAGLQMGTTGNSTGPHLDLEYGRGSYEDFLNFDKKKSFNKAFPEAGLDEIQNTWGTVGGAGGGTRAEAVKQKVSNAFAGLGKKLKLPEMGISEAISDFGNSRLANAIDPKVYAAEIEQPQTASQLSNSTKNNNTSQTQQIQGGLDTLKRQASSKVNQIVDGGLDMAKDTAYKAGEGINALKEGISGIADVDNIFKKINPSKMSGNKIGESGVGGDGPSNLASPNLLDAVKNIATGDIRDAFFKAGGANVYKDFLKPGIDSAYRGALDLNIFKDTFFQEPNRVANTFASTHLAKPATEKYRKYIYDTYPVIPGHDKPTYRATARGRYEDGTEWSVDYDEVDPIYYQNQYNQSVRNSVPAQLKSDFKFTAPVSTKAPKSDVSAPSLQSKTSNISAIESKKAMSSPSLAQAYTQTQSSPALYSTNKASGVVIPSSKNYSVSSQQKMSSIPSSGGVSAPPRSTPSAPSSPGPSRPSAPPPAPTPTPAPKSVGPTYQAPRSIPPQQQYAPYSPIKSTPKPAAAPSKNNNVFTSLVNAIKKKWF